MKYSKLNNTIYSIDKILQVKKQSMSHKDEF